MANLLKVFLIALLLLSVGSEKFTPGNSTRMIVHAMGKTKVPQHPLRVVTLSGGSTAAALLLGVTPVGAVSGFNMPSIGTERAVDINSVAALHPDLIIGTMSHTGIYRKLSFIAPTVLIEKSNSKSNDFYFYANVLNRLSRAEKIISGNPMRFPLNYFPQHLIHTLQDNLIYLNF